MSLEFSQDQGDVTQLVAGALGTSSLDGPNPLPKRGTKLGGTTIAFFAWSFGDMTRPTRENPCNVNFHRAFKTETPATAPGNYPGHDLRNTNSGKVVRKAWGARLEPSGRQDPMRFRNSSHQKDRYNLSRSSLRMLERECKTLLFFECTFSDKL